MNIINKWYGSISFLGPGGDWLPCTRFVTFVDRASASDALTLDARLREAVESMISRVKASAGKTAARVTGRGAEPRPVPVSKGSGGAWVVEGFGRALLFVEQLNTGAVCRHALGFGDSHRKAL